MIHGLFIYMTRKEQKELKLKLEQEFINSIKGKKITSKEKDRFRKTNTWKQFRSRFSKSIDPITLKKVPKRFRLHHCDLNPENYCNLEYDNFVPTNGTMHDIIHYLYGYYRKDRNIIKRLQKVLDKMVELNDGRDIRDYK